MQPLDDLFGAASGPSAVETFTDRNPESVSFADLVDSHLRVLEDPSPSGFEHSRDNLLVFYGIGGLGKTSLSERLEQWITGELGDSTEWGTPPRIDRPLLTTRLDMAERQGLDVERAVLMLRASVGALEVPTNSFDHALALWWQQYHGDQPIPSLPIRRTAGSVAKSIDLAGQLKESVAAAFDDVGVGFGLPGLGIRLGSALRDAITKHRARARAMKNPYIDSVLDRVARGADIETLSALPILLNWDLRQVPASERPLWIVFVDTFELINGDDARRGEREFQRLVVGLQDVLWVVSGRTRLDWGDDERRGALPRTGSQHWPGLDRSTLGTRQHLVGDLTDDDAIRFIHRSLSDMPPGSLPADTIEEIVRRGAGWPLYLDSAVQRARELIVAGQVPARADFAMSFSALVQRVARGLPPDERIALNSACVVPRHSASLVVATAGGHTTESAVERLRERGLIKPQPWPEFSLKVHDSIREQVRRIAPASGGWAVADWQIAAERTLEYLRLRYSSHAEVNRRLDCFSLAMSVALDFGVETDWLIDAATGLPTMEQASLAVPPIPSGAEATWAAHLAAMLTCWTNKPNDESRADRLKAVVESRALPPTIYASAQRFRAYSLRNRDLDLEALEIFERLIDEAAPGMFVTISQRCETLMKLGRLTEARRVIDELSSNGTRAGVLSAAFARWHGHLEEATLGFRERADALQRDGRLRLARENNSVAMETASFLSPPRIEEWIKLRTEAGDVAIDNHYRTRCSAVALATAGDPAEYPRAVAELRNAFEVFEPGESGPVLTSRLWLPNAFDAAIRADAVTLKAAIERINHPMWVTITSFWLPLAEPTATMQTGVVQWAEPEESVIERWQQVVLDRRRHLAESLQSI